MIVRRAGRWLAPLLILLPLSAAAGPAAPPEIAPQAGAGRTTAGQRPPGCDAAQMARLSAHPWRVERIAGTEVLAGTEVTIAFAPPCGVSGRAGCNFFSGTVALAGSALSFGPLATSMIGCPPGLAEQERRFLDALGRVSRFQLAPDGALLLMAGDRTVIAARP